MTRPVNVMHVITSLDVGGAETMLSNVVAHSDADRVHHRVVSLLPGGVLRSRIESTGVSVTDLGMRRGIPSPLALWRLIRLIQSERPDVVQTWLYHADLLGTIAAKLAGAPRLMWNVRCAFMDMRSYARLSRVMTGVLARLSHIPELIIVNSKAGQNHHESLGYRPRAWRVLPNGFDLEQFKPDASARARVRDDLGVSQEGILIGLPARLDPAKDHGTFLAAAGYVVERFPSVRFVLVGAGTEDGNPGLDNMIAASGLEGRVIRLGVRDDMPAIYAALDIVVLSSRWEAFPNVLGEAMACETPCVSTDAGDSADIIGDCGAVVAPQDPERLAQAIGDILERAPHDRNVLGRRARDRVARQFDIHVVARAYDDIYTNVKSEAAKV